MGGRDRKKRIFFFLLLRVIIIILFIIIIILLPVLYNTTCSIMYFKMIRRYLSLFFKQRSPGVSADAND
jgi:hypothetical protein